MKKVFILLVFSLVLSSFKSFERGVNCDNGQCFATASSTGLQCRNCASDNSNYCYSHQKPSYSSSENQCYGKTTSGERCKRMTKNRSGYCWQHEY
jgi:hypothetical protein